MKKHFLPLVALAIGILLGLLALALPAPARLDSVGFSAQRARADIDRIARAPHSAWDQGSLIPVRDHIRERLSGLGLSVSTMRYAEVTDAYGHRYPLENISASIPGKSGSSLLLVSHYDSAPKKRSGETKSSRGAADDGYGVATMLEIAGLLAGSKAPLENGVRFLFTDAEETGLRGAHAEMEQNLAAYADVNLVINLEARGVKGPVVMFETGKHNLATIRLFEKAHRPFGYSFAAEVYRKMPNSTDLSKFIQKGFAGLNFAVLDDLSYYHAPRDNPDNLSLASLQHYGEQILPMIQAYSGDARFSGKEAFLSTEDRVYFAWLPGLFFAWSATWDKLLCLGLALAFLVWAGWMIAKGRAKFGSSLLWLVAWLGVAAGGLGIGLGVSFLVSMFSGIAWRITYMPNVPQDRLITWGLVLGLALASYALAGRKAKQGKGDRSPLIGAMGVNLVLLAVMRFLLPGGTFLCSVPLLVALVAVVLADLAKCQPIALAGVVFALSLFVPVLHIFSLALTFGALGIVLLLAAFPLALAASLAIEGSVSKGDDL